MTASNATFEINLKRGSTKNIIVKLEFNLKIDALLNGSTNINPFSLLFRIYIYGIHL